MDEKTAPSKIIITHPAEVFRRLGLTLNIVGDTIEIGPSEAPEASAAEWVRGIVRQEFDAVVDGVRANVAGRERLRRVAEEGLGGSFEIQVDDEPGKGES